MNESINFIVDAMLGNLSKKLRILGFDSKYFSSIEDSDLIELAKIEGRIIITKDEALARTANKRSISTILITENDEIGQIIEIAKKIGLADFTINTSSALCTRCNGKLKIVEKSLVENKVPVGVFQRQDKFWICIDCKKVYWEGTHFKKIQEFVSRLNQRLK